MLKCNRDVLPKLRRPVFIRLELASLDVGGVPLNIGVPLFRKVIEREDCRNWADWDASAAVDALDRVNEKLVNLFEPRPAVFVLCVLFRMDAVHWAGIHTGRILSADTGFCNYVRHYAVLSSHENSWRGVRPAKELLRFPGSDRASTI